MTSVDSPDWLGAAALGGQLVYGGPSQNIPSNGNFTWGPFLVAGAQSVMVLLTGNSLEGSEWQIEWGASPSSLIAPLTQVLFKTLPSSTLLILPVIAPYLSLEALNLGTSSHQFAPVVVTSPAQNVRNTQIMQAGISSGVLSIPANSSQTEAPTVMVPGPGKFWAQSSGVTNTAELQMWNGTVWVGLSTFESATNEGAQVDVDLPFNDHRIVLINGDAAARTWQAALTVTASN